MRHDARKPEELSDTRRNGRSRRYGAAWFACLALPLAACGSDAPLAAHVTVQLETDFAPGDELGAVRVEVLEAFDDTVVDVGWLTVGNDCDRSGVLGTFEVQTGASRSLRVRATGYRVGAGDVHEPLVETEMSMLNERDAFYTLVLARSCAGQFCAAGLSCNPDSGACEAISASSPSPRAKSTMSCAVASGTVPALVMDEGFATACASGDASCQRVAGCEASCEGPCGSCDVAGHVGECTPVDFTRSNDADHCGACDRPCGQEQAFGADCVNGTCAYSCRDGWADCNADSGVVDGCEQRVDDDANNCGRCGRSCEYAACQRGTCSMPVGDATIAGAMRLEVGEAWGTPIAFETTTTLVGIGGMLQNLSQPAARVRFAVYQADNFGRPLNLVTQTGDVPVVDVDLSLPPEELLSTEQLTYGKVAPFDLLAGTYFVVVKADKPIHVLTGPIGVDLYHFASPSFDPYPEVQHKELVLVKDQPELALMLLVVPNPVQ